MCVERIVVKAHMDKFRPESFLPLTPVAFEILLALADGERHGYSILQEVESRSGGAVSLHAGTLYRALARLLESDLIAELRRIAGSVERRRAAAILPADHARHCGCASGSGTARGTTGGGPHPPALERRRRVRNVFSSAWRCSRTRARFAAASATKCARTFVARTLAP